MPADIIVPSCYHVRLAAEGTDAECWRVVASAAVCIATDMCTPNGAVGTNHTPSPCLLHAFFRLSSHRTMHETGWHMLRAARQILTVDCASHSVGLGRIGNVPPPLLVHRVMIARVARGQVGPKP